MDEQFFYDDFVVEPAHLNRLYDDVLAVKAKLLADHLATGIAFGLDLVEAGTPGLALVAEAGVAYAPSGHRMAVLSDQNVDLTLDYLGASTAPAGGQERILAVYLHPTFTESEPWTDSNGDAHNTRLVQSYALRVVAGASAAPGTAVVPAAPGADDVLLGRVLRESATTAFYTRDVMVSAVSRATRAADVYDDSVERVLEASPTDPPSLAVVVAGGNILINGDHVEVSTATSPTLTDPSVGMSRVDLVHVNSLGALQVRAGTEFATGNPPVYPNTRGTFPVAFVGIDHGQVAIEAAHILDARPMLAAQLAFAHRHRVVLAAAQTVVPLPWDYPSGNDALEVYLDGLRLDPTEFNEISTSSLELVTPAVGGEVLFVTSLDLPEPSARLSLDQVEDDISGLLVWRGCYTAVRSGHQCVVVPSIQACIIGRVRRYTAGETEVVADGLTAGTAYYLYAYASGAAGIAFQLSTTAPDDVGMWKTGTTTHRYLAYVPTDGAGAAYDFRKEHSGYHAWRGSVTAVATFCNLSIAAGAWAGATLPAVPAHARLVRGILYLQSSVGTGGSVAIRSPGTSGSGFIASAPANEVGRLAVDVETDGLGAVDVQAADIVVADFNVTGFWE